MISKDRLKKEKALYEKLYAAYSQALETLPSGVIYFKRQHGKWRPYSRQNGRSVYLSKSHESQIAGLLEQKLIRQSLRQIEQNVRALDQMQKQLVDFDELLPGAMGQQMERRLGKGFRINDYMGAFRFSENREESSARWLAQQGPSNPYKMENRIHTTPAGMKVRSKSELVIGAFLEAKGIPYKYEEQLMVEGKSWYPDFKLRRPRDGIIIIWEHFGMMEDEDYAGKNQYKLMIYGENGYRMWDNLIVTYDEKGSLDMTFLEKIYGDVEINTY